MYIVIALIIAEAKISQSSSNCDVYSLFDRKERERKIWSSHKSWQGLPWLSKLVVRIQNACHMSMIIYLEFITILKSQMPQRNKNISIPRSERKNTRRQTESGTSAPNFSKYLCFQVMYIYICICIFIYPKK